MSSIAHSIKRGSAFLFYNKPKMQKYEIVDSMTKLKRLRKNLLSVSEFSFDTETNTKDYVNADNEKFKLVGISISWGAYHNYYIPVGHVRYEDYGRQLELSTVAQYLRKPFARTDVRIIGHNLKFDMHVLARIGIYIKTKDLFDTAIASWLCDENSPNKLKLVSADKLELDQTHFKEIVESVPSSVKKEFGLKANSKATFDLVLIDDGAPYALDDSFNTFMLYLGFLDELEEEGMDRIYEVMYKPFIHALYDMEEAGVTIDQEYLNRISVEIKKDKEDLEYRMFELAGVQFNPSSSQQLCELLFGYLSPVKDPRDDNTFGYLPEKEQEKKIKAYDKKVKEKSENNFLDWSFDFQVIGKTKGGAPSTDSDTIWALSLKSFKNKRKQEGVELCKLLVDYKKLDKLNSAFIEGLFDKIYPDGKVHPSFNIIGTDSGRLSCSFPNLQQLPKADDEDKYQIRRMFIGSVNEDTGKRNKIVALDFSNLEMRVVAHFSEDKNLLEMFEKGLDTHGSTAVNMFELDCEAGEVKKLHPHLRQAAKILNFLLVYGGGAQALYDSLREDRDNPIDLGEEKYLKLYERQIEEALEAMNPDKRRKMKSNKGLIVAQIYIDKYFDTYSGVAKFIKSQKRYAHKHGYVYTVLMRKRRLPDINSNNYNDMAYCERLSVNSPVQGTAADIVIAAQNLIAQDPWFKENEAVMLIQVHDELVFECPEEVVPECIRRAKYHMENCFGDDVHLNLPLIVEADFGSNYQEAK